MKNYMSKQELYNDLVPALNVKVRMVKSRELSYITKEDIWNYLAECVWNNGSNLSISQMVDDIMKAEESRIKTYLQTKLYNSERNLYFKDSDGGF